MHYNTKYKNKDVRKWFGNRLHDFKSSRSKHEPQWLDAQEFILPRAGKFDTSDTKEDSIPNYNSILNSTATNAVKVWVAFVMAGMSSPARPWFRLVNESLGQEVDSEQRAWMDSFRDLMLELFARSNLYQILPRVYEEGAVFGNSVMMLQEDQRDVIRCYHYTIGEFYWGVNDRLDVDTVYRPFMMTVQQLVSKFGLDNCSDGVQRQYKECQLTRLHEVIHVIEPNGDHLPDVARPVDSTKEFVSIYYESNSSEINTSRLLSVSGYREFPAMAFRTNVYSSDPYGIGNGQEVIGDVKELQHHELAKATGMDYTNEPMLDSIGGIGKIYRHPSAVVDRNPHSDPNGLKPIYQVNFPVQHTQEAIAIIEARIREWFDNHLARHILDNQRSNVTAREIEAGEQEKLLLAGPVLESIQNVLSSIIDRTFEIMMENNIGPPPPESMSGQDLGVEFLGILAQAQKAVGIRAIERTWQFASSISEMKQGDMSIFDNLDGDESLRDYTRMIGTPSDQLIDQDQVEAIRAQRAQQEQMQQAQMQAQQMAETAKTMGDTTSAGEGNALATALEVTGAR